VSSSPYLTHAHPCSLAFCFCYSRNVWHAQNFPFLSQLLFNEDGSEYNQSLILNADFTLNETALAEVGLPWYVPSQTLYQLSRTAYIGSKSRPCASICLSADNSLISAAITHFFIWHARDCWDAIRIYRVRAHQLFNLVFD
jgi:hypothetical protein